MAPVAGSMTHLRGLNAEQRVAVEALDGPVLIIAGAGTGKTRTLTARIAHILKLALARPDEILAVAFTNKAAAELRERIGKMTGVDPRHLPWVGTFHSISARILRSQAERVGLNDSFSIHDDRDQTRILKTLLAECRLQDNRWPAKRVAGLISRWKDQAKRPGDLTPRDRSLLNGMAQDIYRRYQDELRVTNGADFGDLILHVVTILSTHSDVQTDYQAQFRYALVDEFQDVNRAQYTWLRLLTEQGNNVCCVGDDDQAIYSWRGAQPGIMLGFTDHYPDARLIRLEQNYRSTEHILGAAVAVIRNNAHRHDKSLRCADETREQEARKVEVVRYRTNLAEADGVVKAICGIAVDGNPAYRLADIAVSARTWACLAEVEQSLVKAGLPYQVFGGPKFYERKEIRDILAYLRLCHNGADSWAFERSVNTPSRGIGPKTVGAIRERASEASVPMLEMARLLAEDGSLSAAPARRIGEFLGNVERWTAAFAPAAVRPDAGDVSANPKLIEKRRDEIRTLVRRVIEESGMANYYRTLESEDAAQRVENLDKFVDFAGRHQTLGDFLEHVGLMSEEVVDASDGKNQVTLMTLHAAKGSEYPVIFLVAWEEGILPWLNPGAQQAVTRVQEQIRSLAEMVMSYASDDPDKPSLAHMQMLCRLSLAGAGELDAVEAIGLDLIERVNNWSGVPGKEEIDAALQLSQSIASDQRIEEERRLAHVGITRAMERCIISHVDLRWRYGVYTPASPSRFLLEIPAEHKRLVSLGEPGFKRRAQANSKRWSTLTREPSANHFQNSRQPSVRAFPKKPLASQGLQIGDRVTHRRFGPGTVHAVSARNIMVRFDDDESRMVMQNYLYPVTE